MKKVIWMILALSAAACSSEPPAPKPEAPPPPTVKRQPFGTVNGEPVEKLTLTNKNGIEVSAQEMGMLIQQAAAQYRAEDRERFVEFVRSDAMAQAQLRAPLYEDKVVDFLFDKATVTDRQVTREELEAAIEAEETAPAPKPAKKAAKKAAPAKDEKPAKADKAPAKKAAAEKAAAKKPAPKAKAPAKKPAAKKPAAKK